MKERRRKEEKELGDGVMKAMKWEGVSDESREKITKIKMKVAKQRA